MQIKKLILIAMLSLICSHISAETSSNTNNMRDSERDFLTNMQEKKSAKAKNPAPQNQSSTNTNGNQKYELCQTALEKIDKLSLEMERIKMDTMIDASLHEKKIKSLQSQISRYKIQAKKFCPKDLLKQSIHMKY